MKRAIYFLWGCAMVAGCASEPAKPLRPEWIDNPGLGVSAAGETHVKGRYYQEQLAITRGREQIAARYGVEISSVQNLTESVVNEKAYIVSKKQIQQVVKGKEVKTRVRAKWHDKTRDVLWVWVYPVGAEEPGDSQPRVSEPVTED